MSQFFSDKKSTCTCGTMTLPGAVPEQENPYPILTYDQTPKTQASLEIQQELRLNYGNVSSPLPYTMQDLYHRNQSQITLKTITLENSFLKAVFLPEYGARLWSLYDKEHERELLHCNTIFQPANLAVRNAWFAGGVEWNIGFRGHSPFTMDKMFCEELYDETLSIPVLHFYEWERIRQCVFEIFFYLPQDSRRLMVRIKIQNCLEEEVPMYWWSNIAVPETINTRVLVPSVSAYTNVYSGEMTKSSIPYCQRTDITYTATQLDSKDYFFAIAPEKQKFIAAVDENGFGLLQTSTDLLKSRKLFLWGMRRCYRNWQDMLSAPLHPYLEIQAGLAPTQMECIPMPAGAVWEWVESYGAMQLDPLQAHSKEWDIAVDSAAAYVNAHCPLHFLNKELARLQSAKLQSRGTLFYGSGWGALEEQRRKQTPNERPLPFSFPECTLSAPQEIWLNLLTDHVFPCPEPGEKAPVSFMRETFWLQLLKDYTDACPNNWFAWYTLGIGAFGNDDPVQAKTCFQKALQLQENVLTLRAFAFLTEQENPEQAVNSIEQAFSLCPSDFFLAKDVFSMLLRHDQGNRMLTLWEKLPADLKENGRIKLLELNASIQTKNLSRCEQILSQPFTVDDLREGESLFANLWYDYCYLKMETQGILCEDKKEYAETHYEMPIWLDYLFV